uniref:Uncharacterized protein n=1 Tax=Quercus lobata TaxID=97700 RepID=A0A7N2MGK2_QUELO
MLDSDIPQGTARHTRDGVFEHLSPCLGIVRQVRIRRQNKDGCIVCPTTDSTFDLRTGAMKECMRGGLSSDASAEIVFSEKAQPGITATDVNVDKGQQGFGFIMKNEIIKGKAALIGFLLLLDFELLTGKGLLKGTGFLDFLYAASKAFK